MNRAGTELVMTADRTVADEIAWLNDTIRELRFERDEAVALVSAVTAALGNHPECDLHDDDDDPITCGWLHAVVEARRALRMAAES